MRIALVAPLVKSVPPKLYGGTERVVAWLTDELVELGHKGNAASQVEIPTRGPSSSPSGLAHLDSAGHTPIQPPQRRRCSNPSYSGQLTSM